MPDAEATSERWAISRVSDFWGFPEIGVSPNSWLVYNRKSENKMMTGGTPTSG